MLLSHFSDAEKIVRVLCLLLCVAFFAEQASAQRRSRRGGRPVVQQVQPYDPLTTAETELASQIASGDARVREALGSGRQRLIEVRFVDAGDPSIGRHAEVIFIRYDNNRGVVAIVNLRERAVTKVMMRAGTAVPLSLEEVNEALSLALQNNNILNMLGPDANQFRVTDNKLRAPAPRNQVQGYISSTTAEGDTCRNGRCIILIFRRGNRYISDAFVVADLSTQRVRLERSRQ